MAYEDEVLADSPVLYWRLGESSGTTAQDATANNRDGTYTSATLGESGALTGAGNKAVRLPTGGTGHVSRADEAALTLDGTNGMTLEAWIKWDTSASVRTWETILAKGDSSWRVSRGAADAALLNFAITGPSLDLSTSGHNAFDGNWHHIVCVYDKANTDAFVYVDNVTRASNTSTASANPADNAQPARAGSNSEQAGREWQGWIDEVALYDSPLSSARVSAHYAAAFGAPTLGVVQSSIRFA